MATDGRPKTVPNENGISTAADIGLTRKEVHEARQIRDAALIEPGIIHDILNGALDSGDSPTKARLRREIKSVTKEIRSSEQAIKRDARDAHNRLLRLATTATLCCPRPGSSRTRRPQ